MDARAAPRARLSPRVAAAVADAKAGLEALYGDRLVRVVLYGSQARGDAGPGSDVDLLAVLRGDIYWYDEIRRTGALHMSLLLEHDVPICIQPYAEAVVDAQASPFLANVFEDGINL